MSKDKTELQKILDDGPRRIKERNDKIWNDKDNPVSKELRKQLMHNPRQRYENIVKKRFASPSFMAILRRVLFRKR